MVTVCPELILVLSKIISAPLVPTVPCQWQVVPVESMISKWPAVPEADAVADQVPDLLLVPLLALPSQSDGSVIDTSIVPERAAAQLDGGDPVRILNMGAVPIVDSTTSARAFRTASES